jgi:hypothetical protein
MTGVDASKPYVPDFRDSLRFERYQSQGSLAHIFHEKCGDIQRVGKRGLSVIRLLH